MLTLFQIVERVVNEALASGDDTEYDIGKWYMCPPGIGSRTGLVVISARVTVFQSGLESIDDTLVRFTLTNCKEVIRKTRSENRGIPRKHGSALDDQKKFSNSKGECSKSSCLDGKV